MYSEAGLSKSLLGPISGPAAASAAFASYSEAKRFDGFLRHLSNQR